MEPKKGHALLSPRWRAEARLDRRMGQLEYHSPSGDEEEKEEIG